MVSGNNPTLVTRLRQAEEAENEVQRLENLAAQAPVLRVELARSQRQDKRDHTRKLADGQARKASECSAEKQRAVPGMLETVAKMVYSLYTLLKDIDTDRRESMQYMSIVDRMNYEQELEDAEIEQSEMGRDPKGMEYMIASKHGQSSIKELLESLDPGFSYLRDCDLDEPLRRDVANFVLAHVVSPERVVQEKLSQDRVLDVPAEITQSPKS